MFESGSSSLPGDESKTPFRALDRQFGARQHEIRRRAFPESSHDPRSTNNSGLNPPKTEVHNFVSKAKTSPASAKIDTMPINQVPARIVPATKPTVYEQRSDFDEQRAPITETRTHEQRAIHTADEKLDGSLSSSDTLHENQKLTRGNSPGSNS